MSYMALYRKWRPDEFGEVKGQEHIVKTLKNQLTHDRIGHAYLFCGTRGTGKTTVAKLFAKAVNCEHPGPDGSPCNECAMCKSIQDGSSMNVIEIDAASNNGVDNIREIKDEVMYSPTSGRYKVYIIDEVHMLSIGAFNALLKTLEEPPSYVIFILATTEAHKIPITIMSRCQRYDFRRISLDVIKDRLLDLMEREGIETEEKAIRYVAKAADGSMRDALSLLDQCIAFYLGEKLTYDKVLNVLGAVDIETFQKLLQCVIDHNTTAAVDMIDEVIWQGRELSQFVVDFTWYLRNLLLIKSDPQGAGRLDYSKENIIQMEDVANQLSMEALMRYIHIFSGVANEMKYANQKRIILELSIIRLCVPQMQTDEAAILERLRQLENQVEVLASRPVVAAPLTEQQKVAVGQMERQEATDKKESQNMNPEQVLTKQLKPADMEQLKVIMKNWRKYLRKMQGGGEWLLEQESTSVNVGEDGQTLLLTFNTADPHCMLAYDYFNNQTKLDELHDIIAELSGVDVKIQCRAAKTEERRPSVETIDLKKVNFLVDSEE